MRLFATVSLVLLFGSLVDAQLWPQELNCNRLTGSINNNWVKMTRPMETGDVITIEGSLPSPLRYKTCTFNLCQGYAYEIISLHMRIDQSLICYNAAEKTSNWGMEVFTPTPFRGGDQFRLIIKKTPDHWEIYNGGTFLRNFNFRLPGRFVQYFMANFQVTVNAVQMDCARPPITTRAPNNGNNGGHHHHPHHPHQGHKYDKDSSSSSSDECDN